MGVDATQAEAVLAELSAHRVRARELRHGDMWIAAVVAVVSLAGAVAFALETTITTASCSATGTCGMQTSEYDGWALWVAGGAVGTAGLLLARHLRGVGRATTRRWLQRLAILFVAANAAALFAGYSFWVLGSQLPFMFPAAAAFVVGVVAARRRDWLAAGLCLALALTIGTVGMRMRMAGAPWWFDDYFGWWFPDNLGYIASSLLSAATAAAAAVKWRGAEAA
jgi:hypothetical protein